MAEDNANRKFYIGVKGRVALGAVRVPPDRTEIGSVVSESLLYPFYDKQVASRPATSPSPAVMTTSSTQPAAPTLNR